jgi:hypothetical protein
MLFKEEKDKDGFIREVIFLKNNEQKQFILVVDDNDNSYNFGGGVFQKDGKFYVKYINHGLDVNNSLFKVNKLFIDHQIDPLDYHTVMVQTFPIIVKKRIFI